MSYVPSHIGGSVVSSAPNALTVLEGTNNITLSAVGQKLTWSNTRNIYSNFSPAISSGTITLTSGYFYFLEGGIQLEAPQATGANAGYAGYKWYDETASSYIGARGHLYPYFAQDLFWSAADEMSRALIDCTAGDRDVSLRVITYGGQITGVNYTSGSWYQYSGLGRAQIWRLTP